MVLQSLQSCEKGRWKALLFMLASYLITNVLSVGSPRRSGRLILACMQNCCNIWMTGIPANSSFRKIFGRSLQEVSYHEYVRLSFAYTAMCTTLSSNETRRVIRSGSRSSPGQVRVSRAIRRLAHVAHALVSSRAGFPEGRDSYKLKSKGDVVLCYRCKGSAAPVGPGTAQGLSLGRKIVTCDYCPLSWHLDCLEPPAAIMPTSQRKWMCPNHATQVMVSNPISS